MNALFPHQLARLCGRYDARLIHFSTDCVFSGTRGCYTENDPPDAQDLYGRSKLLGEVVGPGCLTIRSSIIGHELRAGMGLLEWFMAQRGNQVRGFANALYTGLTTPAMSDLVARAASEWPDLDGLWQVASEPISKYDLLGIVNRVYGLGITIERDAEFHCDRRLDGGRFRDPHRLVRTVLGNHDCGDASGSRAAAGRIGRYRFVVKRWHACMACIQVYNPVRRTARMQNGAGAAIRIDEFEPARNVGNRLYARLHDDILSGRLRPGQALSETRLAAQHGISRTPVREVFQRLVKDGLLRVVPQIGSFVAPINLAAVADSQFIREALECHAVADAAECATEADVRTLRRQIAQQQRRVAVGDQSGFFALDEVMHRTILSIGGHATVWELIPR